MKKRGLSVFLLSLVLPIIASSNKDSISEYTYISRSSYPSRNKVRFNVDKTLDFFENGKWKHVVAVVPDKENLNFIVHKSDNPEFFQLFYGDDCETGLGVFSEDRRTLYMASVEDDFIFSREETETNLKFATNYTYMGESISELGYSFDKVQFNADNSLDLFAGDERVDIVYVTWPDKKTLNFISRPTSEGELDLIGFFSADEKTLYLGGEGILLTREGLTAEYTYFAESYDDIFKVRFNTIKSLDFFIDNEWKNITSFISDKKNFIVHISDNPELLSDFDENQIFFGFLSEDEKSLYMGVGYIFSREDSKKYSKSVAKSYINKSGDNVSFNKARFNRDNSLDIFVDGEWSSTQYVTWLDKKKQIFTDRPNPGDDVDIVGVFSADEKTLCLGEVSCFFELCSPKLTFDSINVGGITLRSKPEDLIIQYPAARVYQKDNKTDFCTDGLDGFDTVIFTFEKDKLVHISKGVGAVEYDEREDKQKVPALVQKSVQELTAKYGKPKIEQSSSDLSKFLPIGTKPITVNERIFIWYGEVIIKLRYYWSADEYGQWNDGSCDIDYEFDSRDLY